MQAISSRIHIISDTRSGRIRVRTVNVRELAERAAVQAQGTGRCSIHATHGGAVCNSYGYPAQTETVLAVAAPFRGAIHVAVYLSQIPANKVTRSGAAGSNMPESRPLFDGRYGAAARAAARRQVQRTAKADIAHALDPDAMALYCRRRDSAEQRRLAESARPTLAERLKRFRARRLSDRLAAANAALAAEGNGYFVEMAGSTWFHLRWYNPARGYARYVASGLDSLDACLSAVRADWPARQAELEEQRLRAVQHAIAEAARREEDYSASVMASMPMGRIRFDAEGGFRAEE